MTKKARFTTIICTVMMCAIAVAVFMLTRLLISMLGDAAAKLVFTSGSLSADYDGVKLTDSTWSLSSGELKEGHTALVTVSGAQINVGESQNYISARIVDENGRDVSDEYEIEYQPGTLTVNPVFITIVSDSAVKVYDGEPLTDDGYTILGGKNLPPQCEVEVNVVGTITEIGSTDNVVESVVIKDKKGVNISRNFIIAITPGKLVVTDETGNSWGGGGFPYMPETPGLDDLLGGIVGGIAGIMPDISGSVDLGDLPNFPDVGGLDGAGGALDTSGNLGMGGAGNTGGGNADQIVCYQVVGSRDGTVYLKLKSFGGYLGDSWADAVKYGALADSRYSAYYLTSAALEDSGSAQSEIAIKVLNGQFVMPYYTSAWNNPENLIQDSDILCSGEYGDAYTLKYFGANGLNGVRPYEEWAEFEKSYRDYVHQNYTHIDEETLAYLKGIIEEQGFDRNSKDIVNQVAKYVQGCAKYSLDYDRALDSSENVVIDFLKTYKEGICQHYASAATLIYRALDIPARYTIGFVTPTKEGVVVDVTAKQAHAWVEVYYDGIGWVMVEVTGGDESDDEDNDDELGENDIIAKPTYDRKQYDGMPLVHSNRVEFEGFEKWAELGYTIEYTASIALEGDATSIGIHKANIIHIDVHVYDASHQEVTEQFNVKCQPRNQQVYYSALTFASGDRTKEYDGTELIGESSDCSFRSGELMAGHYYEFCEFEGIVAVGENVNRYKVKIFDADGEDVTNWYYVTRYVGKLTVTPREITVKPVDVSKKYDGEALVCGTETEILSGSLADGHEISFVQIEGSQTKPGRSESIITMIVISDAEGNDVTSNYSVTTEKGAIRVTYK